MLIYEKDNKLNIKFDNEVNENPDLQISKEDGKTEVLIDGQPGGGGSNAPLILEFATEDPYTVTTPIADIKAAIETGRQVYFNYRNISFPVSGFGFNGSTLINIIFSQFLVDEGMPMLGTPASVSETSIVYTQDEGWNLIVKVFKGQTSNS